MEMDIVHKYKQTGDYGAVLGIFFDRKNGGNESSPFIESLKFDQTVEGSTISVNDVILSSLLANIDYS